MRSSPTVNARVNPRPAPRSRNGTSGLDAVSDAASAPAAISASRSPGSTPRAPQVQQRVEPSHGGAGFLEASATNWLTSFTTAHTSGSMSAGHVSASSSPLPSSGGHRRVEGPRQCAPRAVTASVERPERASSSRRLHRTSTRGRRFRLAEQSAARRSAHLQAPDSPPSSRASGEHRRCYHAYRGTRSQRSGPIRGSQPARGSARAEILATPAQSRTGFSGSGTKTKKRRVSATIEAPFMDARLS